MSRRTVDARGYSCPHPLLMARSGAAELGTGDELVLLTDNPPTLETISRWAEKEGHGFSAVPKGPGEWEIVIRIG
ncbi:MAG: sulfurtransferase TusA family protein [Euryarchaeota archaeon]|nr:sulfurtransferase TusA family protein [Euryarchaeota archaeon]